MAALPLAILRCPVTNERLRMLEGAELDALNERIASGDARTLGGEVVAEPVRAALVTEEGGLGYAVESDIAALLPDRAIEVAGGAPAGNRGGGSLSAEKQAVRAFYDDVGWEQDEDEVFEDTARFVDMRPMMQEYWRECRLRIGRELPASGDYLLDVASGAVQFPEYVEYQNGFGARVCVDFSKSALTSASGNVGTKAVLVQGDITSLPLQDDSMDAVLSLHTIYHVPRDEQPLAFRELHRVLKPGGVAVVAYSWGRMPWGELPWHRRVVHLPGRLVQRVARRVRVRAAEAPAASKAPGYWFAYDYRWFAGQPWPFAWEVRAHHAFSSAFLERYLPENALGRALLGTIRRAEDLFPRLTGRFGRYPLIVIRKS